MSRNDSALLWEKSRKLRALWAAVAWSCHRFTLKSVTVLAHWRAASAYACQNGLPKFTISLLYLLNTARAHTRSPCLYYLLCNFRFCYTFLFRLTMPYISFLPHTITFIYFYFLSFFYLHFRLFLPFSPALLIFIRFLNYFMCRWIFHLLIYTVNYVLLRNACFLRTK